MNDNKDFVLSELTRKSRSYANIKVIKSYVSQLFEIAELLDYIEYNRIAKVTKFVAEPKKIRLKVERQLNGESLTAEQLLQWISVINEDYHTEKLILQDYLLFMLTLHLGYRKSESYALQWKHVDLENGYISLIQNKDKMGNLKTTKGNKKTKFVIPPIIRSLLIEWKTQQKSELSQIDIKQTGDQFLFTYAKKLVN
ncbi:tyrosine-type recombinase/integrase [Enterococcus devriesei]|uniref:tyrosine-type recombinase/integrase n=1 Tax=Enterococcus devriesei TaxID=319970 RepID=UPI0036D42AAB